FSHSASRIDMPDASIAPSEVIELLSRLVDKSLVSFDDAPEGGRYTMMESVRQYSAERLIERGESHAVRTRHVERFAELARELIPLIRGPEQARAVAVLEAEHDNLRRA